MNRQQKSMLVLAMITAFITAGLLVPSIVGAGDLEPTAGPDDSGSAMYTIEDIYNYLDTGVAGAKRSSGFTEPTSEPDSTMHTLDEIMDKAPAPDNINGATPGEVLSSKTYWGLRTDGTWGLQTGTGALAALPAPVEKTGQTTSYETRDDGDLKKGVTWPNPRFTDNADGTVTDNLTGLIWLKNANCPNGTKIWSESLTFANSLYDGWTGDGSEGDCGLSDGSSAGDWRLPNVKELQSLIDFGEYSPALPSGHPFTGVQSNDYWSSTTYTSDTYSAWSVYVGSGYVVYNDKDYSYYVWPVRSDN